jgi:hypothetical protein
VELLKELTPGERNELRRVMEKRTYEAGEYIIRQVLYSDYSVISI